LFKYVPLSYRFKHYKIQLLIFSFYSGWSGAAAPPAAAEASCASANGQPAAADHPAAHPQRAGSPAQTRGGREWWLAQRK